MPTDLAGAPVASIMACVLFTSGSTGNPKGATRSFDGIHSLWKNMQFLHPSNVVHGSFQPLSHLSEYTVYVLTDLGGFVGYPFTSLHWSACTTTAHMR